MKPLIVGSPEAMSKEPCLEHPDYLPLKPTSRDQWHREIKDAEIAEAEDEVFPKGIDDSKGG